MSTTAKPTTVTLKHIAAKLAERHDMPKKQAETLLGDSPGLRPQDVFINVLEAAKDNWSLGHGVAQFA